ncbi:MAG: 50S ribosomal protein L9 [Alphaproteobacteria bacterium]|nr:50S ribosomal protein L9 [Alphaproteobacteria bacterium]
MQVILLERIEKLGQMGDVVNVKPGFARNYLLPQKKALRATDANRVVFERRRVQLEAQNLERRKEAEDVAARMGEPTVVLLRQASEAAQLYGSVSSRDVADAVSAAGFTVARRQVELDQPIKALGIHPVRVFLHPEIVVTVKVNVARSAEEAQLQSQGVDVTARERAAAEAEQAAAAAEMAAAQAEAEHAPERLGPAS